MKLATTVAVALLAGALVTFVACSPLGMFDALVPKDDGSLRYGQGIAFGADARQRLDVYAPTRAADGRPVIVFFYGGSWQTGMREGYGFVGRALAAQGFVVVIPDYRLVPAVRFPAFVEDGAAAVRWARANVARYGGNGERMVLAGHSAGAYIAAMLALDPRWLGADREAVRGFVGLAGPYDFLPLDGPITRAAFGDWPRPEETQPVTYAGAGDPPALLLHGDEDATVLPRNSEELASRLAAAGVAAELKLYPQMGHVGIVTAIALPFRGTAPVLADLADFAQRVTAESPKR